MDDGGGYTLISREVSFVKLGTFPELTMFDHLHVLYSFRKVAVKRWQ